jgi:hypothetical protein
MVVPQIFSVAVPKDAAPGALALLVADGTAAQSASSVTQFTPAVCRRNDIDTQPAISAPTALCYSHSPSLGIVIGANEMPNLPPSVLATMNNDRTAGGSKSVVQTVVAEKRSAAGEYIVHGFANFEFGSDQVSGLTATTSCVTPAVSFDPLFAVGIDFFFPNGNERFSSLMSLSHASNAACLCGAATE